MSNIHANNSETCPDAKQYKKFHPNQVNASQEIIHLFEEGKHYVQLQAQMQSGKTGTSLYTGFENVRKFNRNVYVLSGMSDIDLKEQWKAKKIEHQNNYLDPIVEMDERSNIRDLIDDNFKVEFTSKPREDHVYFNTDLKKIKNIEQLKNSLLIIDEIHYGATEDSQLHQLFKRLGIAEILTGKYCSRLVEYNIKILSVSATRAVEDCIYNDPNNSEVKNLWGRVYMEPGDNYKGVIEYYNAKQIKPFIGFKEDNKGEIIKLLESYKSQNKYMLIRATGIKITLIESILTDLKIPVKKYDQKNTDVFDTIEPTEFTVILIKGKLRLGKELNKTHICAVYESSDKMNDDTLLQGLVGRVCGYNVKQDINIYVPKTQEEIRELVQTFDLVNRNNSEMALNNTKFVPKRKANTIYHTHTPEVNVIKSDEEEDEEDNSFKYFTIPQIIEFGNVADEDFGFYNITDNSQIKSYIPQLLSKLDYTQYSEEQQKEIQLLKNTDKNITIRDSHKIKNNKLTKLQYDDKWIPLENCILEKKQFKLFNTEPIIIIRLLDNIPNTSFKKHLTIVIFRLNNKNTIIEQPFMRVKMGEMHTPKNDSLSATEIHTTTEDYTSARCETFKDSNKLLEDINSKIRNFALEPETTKILRLRHTHDIELDFNKPKNTNKIIGIISNKKKNDLKAEILKFNIPNISIQNTVIHGKNNSELKKTGFYIYKEIIITLKKY